MKKTLFTLVLLGLIQIGANAAYSIADQALDSTKYEAPKETQKNRKLADTGKKITRVKGKDQ